MYTDEPSVSLKLKKGGKVASKAAGQAEGFNSMVSNNAKVFEDAESGKSPKKPSMAERRKAMNPQMYKKGGKVAHKLDGGAMGVANPPQAIGQAQPIVPMGQAGVAGMDPRARQIRAAQVRKALTGMKKGGSADHKMISKLEKELHHHESLSCGKAHKKASGGAIDRDETRTTIEKDAKKFERTKVVGGDHHDKHHGTGQIKDGRAAGYAKGGSTGERAPSDTHEKYNKGKTKFGETIEDNEGDYINTQMHGAKKDKASGTGGVAMSNAGGFKRGGRMQHKAEGGLTRNTVEGGDWENRPADTAKPGKRNTHTGAVKESNAGGYKRGGHAAKKAFATGGNVVSTGRAVAMPKKALSQPIANSLQSGTFKKGGKVEHYYDGDSVRIDPTPSNSTDTRGERKAKGGSTWGESTPLRLVKTHTGSKGHVAKVYKDKDWGEHRVKFYNAEGKHLPDADYHTDDVSDAHDTARHMVERGYKRGGKTVKKFEDGGRNSGDAMQKANTRGYNATYANETAENEADAKAMKDALTYIPRKIGEFAKNAWDKVSGPSVTDSKTTVSRTVSPPAKKRGGRA